jgi:hypothetical protein
MLLQSVSGRISMELSVVDSLIPEVAAVAV